MNNEFKILVDRLNAFIDKFYINKIIKGAIIVPLCFISVVLFVSYIEYIGWFSINIRLFILLFSVGSIIFFFISYLLIPILRYFNITNRITKSEINNLLCSYFPDIQDNIINILELNNLENSNTDLVISSINQKIYKLDSFNFNEAINFKDNFKFLRFLVIAVLAVVLTFLFKPNVFTEGTVRIVNYKTEYVKDIGVEIEIDTNSLFVKRGNDLELFVDLKGDKVFSDLFIVYGGREFLLEHVSKSNFSYLFKNVNSSFNFYVKNDFIRSKNYTIKIIDVPILKSYEVNLDFPEYLNRDKQSLHNISNLNVPQGTSIGFTFNSLYCDEILIQNSDTTFRINGNHNQFKFNTIAYTSINFSVQLINSFSKSVSDILLTVKVINDLYPSISVNYVKDEDNYRLFYFKGLIKDDYGFSKLKVFDGHSLDGNNIPLNKNLNEQEFYYYYEFPVEQLNGQVYFQIYDNDVINGYKSTKSEIIKIQIPDIHELAKQQNKEFEQLEKKLDQSLLLAKELEKDISEIKKSLINEKLETWEKQAKLKSISDKHKQLNEIVNELSKKNKSKDVFKNSFSESDQELLEKQKEIQELFDNLMTDEIKKLIEDLNKLAEDFSEKQLNKLSEDLEFNYKDLSEQLDKNLELLKRFEIEEQLNNKISELNQLAKNQDKLSEELSINKMEKDSLLNKNKADLDKLNTLQEEYNDVLNKNSELEKPFSLDDFSEEIEKIENNISDNNTNISDGEGEKKAKKNSKDLKNLADKMQNMMNSNMQQQAGEDANVLRQLLENLFVFSFNQEYIMNELQSIQHDNPKYLNTIKKQNDLVDDFTIIRDSLYELGKRNAALGFNISKAAFTIENELINIKDLFENKNTTPIRNKQREILSSSNDMILLLTESLKNMDSMGGSGGSGNNKKKKPNKGNSPSMSDMKKSQESFKKQLESMLNQMKGNSGKPGKEGTKQLGQMLAQQEIMQQMMNELLNNGGVGSKASKLLKEIKKLMDTNKRDLVNMNLSNNTLDRQKQILTRLLEAESAELERDKDDKRESEEALNKKISNPQKLFDNSSENVKFIEIFNTKTVNLFDFYKYKYQEYLIKVNSQTNEERN